MELLYYSTRLQLDNRAQYLIWFTSEHGEPDGVWLLPDGTIPLFPTESALMNFASQTEIKIVEPWESGAVNFDLVIRWAKRKKRSRIRSVDCAAFLNAWNMLSDISNSINGDFDADRKRTQRIYEKLFWGNNLPSMTPPGKVYVPLWSNGRSSSLARSVHSWNCHVPQARNLYKVT